MACSPSLVAAHTWFALAAALPATAVENLLDARHVHINERAMTNPEELTGTPPAPRRISVGIDVRLGR